MLKATNHHTRKPPDGASDAEDVLVPAGNRLLREPLLGPSGSARRRVAVEPVDNASGSSTRWKILLMVEPSPFTYVCGYANRFNETLRFLSRAGDEVEIVTADFDRSRYRKAGDDVGESGDWTSSAADVTESPRTTVFGFKVHIARWTFALPGYRHMPLSLDFPSLKGLSVIRRLKPDLIHVSSPGFMVIAAILYSYVMHIPLVMSYHTHIPVYAKSYIGCIPWNEKLAWLVVRVTHSLADITLVTSPQMRDELMAHGVARVDVWKKGIDTNRFHPRFKSDTMRCRLTSGNPDDFLMVYVGRLGAEKRLMEIKQIMAHLSNVRLCIVGTGPQEDELRRYFHGTKTLFTGQLAGDELSEAFASADVFVMPSDSETLGFVVLEAMASGVPVVAANAGGTPDLIEDGITSFLVPPGDIDAYANRIRLLQREELVREHMGEKARNVAEQWGWEGATTYLRTLQYKQCIANFSSRMRSRPFHALRHWVRWTIFCGIILMPIWSGLHCYLYQPRKVFQKSVILINNAQ